MPKHIDVKELNKIFEVHDTKVHALKNVVKVRFCV
jgi:hypothetical protein